MTNPDPLEVAMLIGPFELKILNQKNYGGEHREWLETITVPRGNPDVAKAAAAIIAQHYAPVIAEVERLRGALERIADPRNIHFAGDAQVVAANAIGEKS